jgi:hypothetical protein
MPLNFDVNYIAVIVAAIINMVLGAIWYSPFVFGKIWMTAMKKTKEDIKGQNMVKTHGLSLVSSVILAFILAAFVGLLGASTLQSGAIAGFFVWLGFVVTTNSASYLYEFKPLKVYEIYMAYQLVALVAMGALLAVWV